VAAPLAAALAGSRGPHRLVLNLGPGDGPYVSGFAPEYEIDDKVATHWTTYDATVALPLSVAGGPVTIAYRYARMFGETAQVEVGFAGRTVDRFTARGGAVLERTVVLGMVAPSRIEIAFKADSHERRDRGLKLDWVRVDTGPETRVRLVGAARWRAAALVLVLLALLYGAGWTSVASAALAAPLSVLLCAGLLVDPWLTHRFLTAVPETLLGAGIVGLLVAHGLLRRGSVSAPAVKALAALCLGAFLIRAAAVNHPDFYYPDLRTHARLVQVVRAAGLDFFRSPSTYIWEHGVWRTEAYGRTYAFPYTPAFHLPFSVWPLSYDGLVTALKLGGVVVSLVPLVLVWAMARRLGASPLAAALMVVIPTYTSRLSWAFLPSLFGHAFDMALVCWLIAWVDAVARPAVFGRAVLWIAASQLAYVSGVMNTCFLVGALALLEPSGPARERLRRAGLILAAGLCASALSVALYYRDFLSMFTDVARRAGGAHGAVSRYEVQGFFAVAGARTFEFFGVVWPVLAIGGLWGLRGRPGYRVLLAWLAAYFALLLGRAKVPDVFLHGHETLFVTPLVCLTAGEALSRLWTRGTRARCLAVGLGVFLAASGLLAQWRSIADQLGNAR
jgi:hypothetical protein